MGSETHTRLHTSAGSPEPSLITFVISTSPHGFIMLGSSDSKKKIMRKDAWALRRCSPCRTHTRVRSLHLIVARSILKLLVFGEKGSMITVTFAISARGRGCVHVFACHEWTKISPMIATKACKFASDCSLNLAFIRVE